MIYELVIEDENIDEVFAISLVEEPATESNFIFFDKEKVQFAALNDEKHLVMGAILIPDKQILRIDGEGKPYYVFFKPETIKRLSEMYLKKKYTDKSTLEHDKKINGVTLVESWIKESLTKDKSSLYGLNTPVGSWMGTFKIDNDEIWNDFIKTGEVKGFSIEGLFGHNLVSAALVDELYLNKEISDLNEQEAAMLLTKIRTMFESYSDYGEGEQPSVNSTYPGQAASGSVAPALLAELPNLDVYGYETKYFQICPGAQKTFTEIVSLPNNEETIGMIRSAAVVADAIFKIENDVLEAEKATPKQLKEAVVLVEDFKGIINEIDKQNGTVSDISYMDGHIKTIESFL